MEHQQLCSVYGVLVDGRQGNERPGGSMDHRRSSWWLRLHAREEGLLESYHHHPRPDNWVRMLYLCYNKFN